MKRIIHLQNVSGQMHMVGSHFVSFDTSVLPYEKIRTWYLPPVKPEDEFETGNDDTVIILDKLGDMKVSQAIWERGREYYVDNHVRYICVEIGHGSVLEKRNGRNLGDKLALKETAQNHDMSST